MLRFMQRLDLPLSASAGSAFDLLLWDAGGLMPVVAWDELTDNVLMAAHANRCSLAETLRMGWATSWSRSRNAIWVKGATSGNRQRVVEVRADCDGDHFLYVAEATGPDCHTGRRSCLSWRIDRDASLKCDQSPMVVDGAERSWATS